MSTWVTCLFYHLIIPICAAPLQFLNGRMLAFIKMKLVMWTTLSGAPKRRLQLEIPA